MSKISQAHADLIEQATEMGYRGIEEAEQDGCRITYDNGKLKLVKDKE